jgi:hypothetical protein
VQVRHLANSPQVLKQLRPLVLLGTFDDLYEGRSHVYRSVAIERDDVLASFRGQFLEVFQVRSKFWEKRTDSASAATVVSGLGRSQDHLAGCKVDVFPLQRNHFAGHPKSAVAGQCDDGSPLGIGHGCDHSVDCLAGDEVLAGFIGVDCTAEFFKGI